MKATDVYNGIDKHYFLLTKSGDLIKPAHEIPNARTWIEDLPKLKASFKVANMEVSNPASFNETLLTFLKTWPLAPIYGSGTSKFRRYINPNYAHTHRRTDVYHECQCGRRFTSIRKSNSENLRDEHNHGDSCRPYHWYKGLAEIYQKREWVLFYCGYLGWDSNDMAKRLGTSPSTLRTFISRSGYALDEIRHYNRWVVGNTFKHLNEQGYSYQLISDIYGVDDSTLYKWRDIDPPDFS